MGKEDGVSVTAAFDNLWRLRNLRLKATVGNWRKSFSAGSRFGASACSVMSQERILYWASGSSPCWRAMIGLEEKGLAYESKLLEFSSGEHKGPEVMALNPRGQVPTFKDGDAVVNESNAILLYLEEQYPEKPLVPKDPVIRARVYQRLIEVEVSSAKFRPYAMAKMQGLEDPDEEQHIADMKAELKLWESYAGEFKYIAADTFTLADATYAPIVLATNRFGCSYANYPNIKKYMDTVKDYPSVKKTCPPHWLENAPTMHFMNVLN